MRPLINAIPSRVADLQRPARIGIDVGWMSSEAIGTGVYTCELVQALLRHDTVNTYVLYFRDARASENPLWQLAAPNVEKRVVGPRVTNLRTQALAYHLYRDQIDLFHSTGFFLPYLWFGKKVVTIHDVNYLRFGYNWRDLGLRAKRLSLLLQTPLSARVSRKIIAVSQFGATDIVRYLHVSPAKVHTVPNGVRSMMAERPSDEDMARLRQRFALDRYVLSVGVLAPQKNLERLIRAFARLPRDDTAPLKLVLAGRNEGLYADYANGTLRPLVAALGLQDAVVFAGFVTDAELRALYAGAICVAQVSEGEGFGLPIVEAMASGTPMVSADTTAMVEVAGDASLRVDPLDIGAIAAALARLCTDEPLRALLRRRGLQRASLFTWEHAAEQTLAVYRAVLQG